MSRSPLCLVLVLVAVLVPSCDRLAFNLGGGISPGSGLLRGKVPGASRAVTHVARLTDGIAAKPGDEGRTDLTALFTSPDASATWVLGAETPVRCALVDADGDDSYTLSLSSDGVTFTPLWTAAPDEDRGQQLRVGRGLNGSGRFLRLQASAGDGKWSVSEVSAWSDCPTTWPTLAMQTGAPDDEGMRTKLGAFCVLALAYALLYRRRAPDWLKLLGVVPAGLAVAIVVEVARTWPPAPEVVRLLFVAAGVAVIALGIAGARARRAARAAADASPPT